MGGKAKDAVVLIVDDDQLVREMLRDMLQTEYQVLLAENGADGLRVLRESHVDLILADQMMPELSGTDMLREALESWPATVRLLLTASDRVEDVKEAINVARVHGFLSKPVRLLELRAMVSGLLREAHLRKENNELLDQLQGKNGELEAALSTVRQHQAILESEVESATTELRAANEVLQELAVRDGLTGLYNHRYFQECMTTEVSRAGRHDRELSLLFLDVDHFKNFNDSVGHPAGDALLKQLARILLNTGRTEDVSIRGRLSDVAARYGGEEFVIILPETDPAGAMVRAQRIRECIADYPFLNREIQPGGKLTVSVGVSSYPQDGRTKEELIESADQALLEAKRTGRNKVLAASGRKNAA